MNSAPIVTPFRTNATFRTLIPLTEMFIASDPDASRPNLPNFFEVSPTIERYRVRDLGDDGGRFVLLAEDFDPFSAFFFDPIADADQIVEEFAEGVTFVVDPDDIDRVFYLNDDLDESFTETFSIEAFDGIDASDFATNQIFANPNFGLNSPPLLSVNAQVVPINGQLAFTDMFTLSDLEDNVQTVSVRDNGAGGGFFTLFGNRLEANRFHEIRFDQLNSVVYNGADRRLGETFSIQAFDGEFRSQLATAPVFTGNARPVVNPIEGARVAAADSIPATDIFNVTDADNDAIESYFINDLTTDPNSGFWSLNGQAQPAGSFFSIIAAELPLLRFVGGFPGGNNDTVAIQAFDGFTFSEIETATIRTSARPTVVSTGTGVLSGDSVLASTLFDVQDSDGDTPVTYFINDKSTAADTGFFTLDGNRLASASFTQLNAAQFARLRYVGGSRTRNETISVQVFDGFEFSAITDFLVATTTRPTLSVTGASVFPGRSIDVSSLVNFQDVDGDAPVAYRVLDRFVSDLTGNFVLDGNSLPSGEFFEITAAEFDRLQYVGGDFGPLEEPILISASDGTAFSAVQTFNITTLRNANAPVLRAFDVNGRRGSTVNARSLFSFFDADGDNLSTVTFTDNSAAANGNFFAIDGIEQPAQRSFTVDFSVVEAGRVTYTLGQTGVPETFRINASDGTNTGRQVTGTGSGFFIPQIAAASASGNDISIETLEAVQVSSLITQIDGGQPLDRYQVFDPNTEFLSGTFQLDGVALQQGVIHQLNAAQFDRLLFVGAEVDDGQQLDPVLVQAGNELGFSDFIRLNISTDQLGFTPGPRPLQFVPAPGQVPGAPLDITYTFIDTVNPLPAYYDPINDDEADGTDALNRLQREDIRIALDNIESFADIRFVEVPYEVTASDAQITFGAYDFPNNAFNTFSFPAGFDGNNGFGERGGDIWFNTDEFDPDNFTDVGPGTEFREAALGAVLLSLDVPLFDNNLSIFNDFQYNTVFSDNNGGINDPLGVVYPEDPSTLQLLDVVAVQAQFGANPTFNDDNNHYFFNETALQTLYDAGGIDTINFQARTESQLGVFDDTIDLRQGQFSSINGLDNSLRIALGTVIENARGGDGNDTLIGNETANRIFGNGGNDTITGGGGNDALIGGNGNDIYQWSLGDGRDLITERSTDGFGGRDILIVSDPSNQLNSLEDDFTFRRFGNDLRIDLTFDQGAGQGTVTIRDFANVTERVELLRLVDISGNSIGNDISLNSIFQNATTEAQRFQVTANLPADLTAPDGELLGIATPV